MLHLILIVEDDRMMLDVLAGLFSDEGYRVQCAEDGQEALDLVAAEVPAALVSDVSMPRLDGVELVHRLRTLGHTLPIVLISGRVKRVTLPGVPFLAKPFDLDHIATVVRHSLAAA